MKQFFLWWAEAPIGNTFQLACLIAIAFFLYEGRVDLANTYIILAAVARIETHVLAVRDQLRELFR